MIIVAFKNLVCVFGLIIISPFLAFIGLLILFEDGFPIFFSQKRYGLNKAVFRIYKIRTLKKDAPQLGSHEIDNRYKLFSGTIARNLKLDEFPQLINVLKGDINLVGPRPGLITQTVLEKARTENDVFKIKPGITGLGQILGFDMSDPKKLAEIDKIYIDNHSNKIDLMILFGTFFKYPRKHLVSKLNINYNK
jgi:Sugar transferases involved in lipopolysaccharide synthesis